MTRKRHHLKPTSHPVRELWFSIDTEGIGWIYSEEPERERGPGREHSHDFDGGWMIRPTALVGCIQNKQAFPVKKMKHKDAAIKIKLCILEEQN